MKKIFITGTDTEVGKTYITTGLLKLFNNYGFRTMGFKPVASGGFIEQGLLYNQDALAIQNAASVKLTYKQVNPITFAKPIAPSIAALDTKYNLTVSNINQQCYYATNSSKLAADICIIEGVGGWHVPLNNTETMADLVKTQNLEVILVVAIKLGCLNHALLTYNALINDDVKILGWIANIPNISDKDNTDKDNTSAITDSHAITNSHKGPYIHTDAYTSDIYTNAYADTHIDLETTANINTLKTWLKIPLLGVVPYNGDVPHTCEIVATLLNSA